MRMRRSRIGNRGLSGWGVDFPFFLSFALVCFVFVLASFFFFFVVKEPKRREEERRGRREERKGFGRGDV